ncbi:hypothetical protein TNIN_173441 [Trichonephila inaurata madagascariensis]|uniref:Uncharacterized protein n=1 Tax=Trichonephila inaurata madagascariensis TaxID=2747483 RepID=A0A8X6YVI0_9ARAC|nr:hypothetical protein TNIN_173441 [Trichonephila inaurata madagascariensis]
MMEPDSNMAITVLSAESTIIAAMDPLLGLFCAVDDFERHGLKQIIVQHTPNLELECSVLQFEHHLPCAQHNLLHSWYHEACGVFLIG